MDFVSRLRSFMDSQSVTNSQFADTCNIPRPTLTQLLAGRNKKISNELIGKIHEAYPWLNVMWLMFGEGPMVTGGSTQTSEPQKTQNQPSYESYSTDFEQHFPSPDDNFPSIDFGSEKTQQSETPHLEPADAQQAGHGTTFQTSDSPSDDSMTDSQPDILNFDEDDVIPEASENLHTTHASTPAATTQSASSNYSSPPSTTSATSVIPGTSFASGANEATAQPGIVIPNPSNPARRITNIVVFYDDNSFQSFTPSPSGLE